MDKDRIKGATRETTGAIKQVVGKLTGNRDAELKGALEKAVGKAQRKVGKTKDSMRDALDKIS